mmetsp:Transcript_6484/g.18890  ORF Transcript_6484/g.18890 Transcript_6484/m.18890 type:complete len:235 (+) Transcript_6484:22-726(+)
MSLALLGGYADSDEGESDDSESRDEGESKAVRDKVAVPALAAGIGDASDDDAEDDCDNNMPKAGAVVSRMQQAGDAEAGDADAAPRSLLPSAADLLDDWTPNVARPAPPRQTPGGAADANGGSAVREVPRAPQVAANGMVVPPQVSRGKANVSTEDQSDRVARTAAEGGRSGAEAKGASAKAGGAGSAVAAKGTGVSWRQKEKRKRDMGQQGSGKDYVQEEKRMLRHAGANFDA